MDCGCVYLCAALNELLSVSEAKLIAEPVVYGLCDLTGKIFYVGKTVCPRRRFQAHREGKSKNRPLSDRIRALGSDLRIVVLERSPSDINAAERLQIAAHDGLLNLIGADSHFWAKNSEVPWAAGTGVHCPSVYLAVGLSAERRDAIRKIKASMTDADRCKYEASLFFDLERSVQKKLLRWYEACRVKMISCIEAQDGILVEA